MKFNKFVRIAGILSVLIFILYLTAMGQQVNLSRQETAAGTPVSSPSQDANAIMAKVFNFTKEINNFKIEFQILSDDSTFLDDVFGVEKTPGQRFPVKGELDFRVPTQMGLHLETILNEKADIYSQSGYMWNLNKAGETSEAGAVFARHPLSFLVPYSFWTFSSGEHYLIKGEESVYEAKCYVIDDMSVEKGTIILWVSKDDYSIRRIEFTDPATGKKYAAFFRNYYSPKGGIWCCTQMEVTSDGKALYAATFTNLETNLATIAGTSPGELTPSPSPTATQTKVGRRKVRRGDQGIEEGESFLTPVNVILIILILAAAGWFYFQYVQPYLLRRKIMGAGYEFSPEIIVADSKDGKTAEAIRGLGYKTIPFKNDLISESIEAMRAPGTAKPRIVAVGPNAFSEIKENMPLIKTYVIEGGRILVLSHNLKGSKGLPFSVNFYSYNPWDTSINYRVKLSIWKSIPEKDVAGRHTHIMPSDVYVTAGGKKIDNEIINAKNETTGAEGTAIGLVDEGKGKYLLCQYKLIEAIDKGLNLSIARGILQDIISFLLK